MKRLVKVSLVFGIIFSLFAFLCVGYVYTRTISPGPELRLAFGHNRIANSLHALIQYFSLALRPLAIFFIMSGTILGYFGIKKKHRLMTYASALMFGLLIGLISLRVVASSFNLIF
jgi:hypothetical protein